MSTSLRFKSVEEASSRKARPVEIPAERPEVYYASKVFNRQKMFEYLSKEAFDALAQAIDLKRPLPRAVADAVAEGMRRWAIDNGARHYTHWFQPMTDGTAEKHDAFIEHDGKGGVIEKFTGKLLVQQEPDASSFPNGGIRNTFEARGYSAWDISSPAFIVDNTLCIPTIFISYTGEALDYKTPLLRALNSVDKAATRVARMFDPSVKHVNSNLGWEQEYFLVDESLYAARPDLVMTGRTLMGHESAKNQQLEDHYFGAIPSRVEAFMLDLEIECHKLGIPAKTRHNEVAPNQFELAPIFEETNLANDHNLLLMSLMAEVARRHNFRVLLHEKPFAGVNGSGKHDNWALSTDNGQNLLSPGDSPLENAQFLTFLAAIVKGVDDYAELLRLSVATAGNDHRLGANEAPPAVISIFLGEELDEVVKAMISGGSVAEKSTRFDIGVSALPKFKKDTTDRNRTSPFAFTGNKFEFRMVGSTHNIATPNIVLNTIVAESLSQFADELEKADNFEKALHELLVKTFKEHQRIIFNGNGYDDAWIKEAVEKRGLPNLKSTVDAIPHFEDEKAIRLFTKHKVFTEREIHARTEILLENYYKTINIEAHTVAEMVARDYTPAVMKYEKFLCDLIASKKSVGVDSSVEMAAAARISSLASAMTEKNAKLSELLAHSSEKTDVLDMARYYHDDVFTKMNEIRTVVDELETLVAAEYWPVPTYGELLFSVK